MNLYKLKINMDKIDAFYFINLDRRTDRLQQIMGEFVKMGIPLDKIIRVSGINEKIGILGCTKSHCIAINHFVKSGKQLCLILEDDFEFTETKEKVDEVLGNIFSTKNPIDCLMLSGNDNSVMATSHPNLTKIFFACTTGAYILPKHFAPSLLHTWNEAAQKQEKWIKAFGEPENVFNLDFYWIYSQVASHYYYTNPKLGKQRDSPSDVSGTSKVTMLHVAPDKN
jgi:hypothetical protein